MQVQRSELLLWLGFIKTRNLGQMPFSNSPMEEDCVPMSTGHKPRCRLLTARQMQRPRKRPVKPVDSTVPVEQNGVGTIGTGHGNGSVGEGGVAEGRGEQEKAEGPRGNPEEDGTNGGETGSRDDGVAQSAKPAQNTQEAMYGSYIQPVPVIIVGSHYDQLEGQSAVEAVQQTQRLVDELRDQYEEYLDISPQLYPLNCLKAVSAEIRALKERLCVVRSKLVDVRDVWVVCVCVCVCVCV